MKGFWGFLEGCGGFLGVFGRVVGLEKMRG